MVDADELGTYGSHAGETLEEFKKTLAELDPSDTENLVAVRGIRLGLKVVLGDPK